MKYLPNVATVALDPDRCTGCSMCEAVCPHGVMAVEDGRARILDRDLCMECGACARNCPTGAVTVEAGVGCAAAVINSALGRRSACCSLDDYRPGQTACGCQSGKDDASGEKDGRTG